MQLSRCTVMLLFWTGLQANLMIFVMAWVDILMATGGTIRWLDVLLFGTHYCMGIHGDGA